MQSDMRSVHSETMHSHDRQDSLILITWHGMYCILYISEVTVKAPKRVKGLSLLTYDSMYQQS